MKTARSLSTVFLTLCIAASCALHAPAQDTPHPNVIIFFTDDQGYGDLSCFGHPTLHTPHLDQMANEGMKLTQFYVSQPLCSPSRASLLTGCYAKRIGMHQHVIFPSDDTGMHTDEYTIADMLKAEGYATGLFGKWHLGHRPGLMPTDQGFDVFFGLPFSNDMSQFHRDKNTTYPFSLPLMRNNDVVEWEPDQHLLTKRSTEEAIAFIKANKDTPFFAYIPYAMPHIPIYASQAFQGTSKRGRYGDVIQEIDWSVGQIFKTLKAHRLDQNTIVIFASDNGPWKIHKQDGGSAGPFRGAKGTNYEGGHRVPCIVHWPGHIPGNTVCSEMTTSMDILPTLAEFTGAKLSGNKIDGGSIADLLLDKPDAKATTNTYLYYDKHGQLAGIRQGPWKLLFTGKQAQGGPFLYHLETDIGEEWNQASKQPERVAKLQSLARKLDEEISQNARPTRKVDETLWEWPKISTENVCEKLPCLDEPRP